MLKNGPRVIDNTIMKQIKNVFPLFNFHIQMLNPKKKHVAEIISILDRELCVELHIYHKHIFISSLKKCEISGTEILDKIYYLARSIPDIEFISLRDESIIKICEVEINLAELKILTKGESWYNSLGYISENYKEEKEHNKRIIDMRYDDFLKDVNKRDLDIFTTRRQAQNQEQNQEPNTFSTMKPSIFTMKPSVEYEVSKYTSKQKEETDKGNQWYPRVDLSVKEYFNYIWNDIKNNSCDETNDKYKWLDRLISKISMVKILQYEHELKKNINREKLGGDKTKKRKNIHTKKRKNIHTKKRK